MIKIDVFVKDKNWKRYLPNPRRYLNNQAKKINQSFENPCTKCPAPCLSACPVDAFTEVGYDVVKCKEHISGLDSSNCKSLGCNTRRACPVGANLRNFEQSSFHMDNFLG